jgi:hypothetical protein
MTASMVRPLLVHVEDDDLGHHATRPAMYSAAAPVDQMVIYLIFGAAQIALQTFPQPWN